MRIKRLIKDKKGITKTIVIVLLIAAIVFLIFSSTALIAQNETTSTLTEEINSNETNQTEPPIVEPECLTNEDCDDNNESTIDLCIEGNCSYQEIVPQQPQQNETNLTNFTLVIEDYEGHRVYAQLSIYDKQEKKWEKIDREAEVEKGKHKVKIKLTQTIKEIEIDSLEITEAKEYKLRIDEVPLEKSPNAEAVQIYAIDPTQLEFSEAIVTVKAKGTELWKCKDWDFDSRTCNGEWTYLMAIVPGQDYSFTLTPEDPAYIEYNYSNYQIEGHMAWSSDNALSKPPSGGPAVPNEKELNSTQYSQINASDNIRASVASANYRTFRFMFKLNQSTSRIVNLTIAWEGYTTGANAVQRRVDLYVWNFTSNSWSASLANNNLAADYWLRYTFAPSSPEEFKHIINSTNHIIFLVETPDPPGTQTFYTDMANISVWADIVGPNITFISPTPPNGSSQNESWVTINASVIDDMSVHSCILDWNGTNESMKAETGSGVTCWINKTNLAPGNYTYRVYANDSYGNWNVSETRTIEIREVCAIAIGLSEELSKGILWNVTILPASNLSAIGNNEISETSYNITIYINGNCRADLYMRAEDDLKTETSQIIGLGNETYCYNLTDPNVPGVACRSITKNFVDNLIGSDLNNTNVIYLKFYLNVPSGQPSGIYKNNITIKGVKAGENP
ncbi:MAG: hypothetical protein QW484_00390 [Candidatus Pacearchaeota archaeon]